MESRRHHRWTGRIGVYFLVAATVIVVLPAGRAHATMPEALRLVVSDHGVTHTPGPLQVRIEVSHKGFNGSPDLEVDAQVGQRVELTFVWADQAVPDNAHRIYIRGFELKTSLLDFDNPEDTLSFVADRTGTFDIVCDWRCEGHKTNLQDARLVIAPAPGMAGAVTPSVLGLGWSPGADDALNFTASLLDARGQPLPGQSIGFFTEGRLAGTSGLMAIGEASTDRLGDASISYRPSTGGETLVVARFAGSAVYAANEAQMTVETGSAGGVYTEDRGGLNPLQPWVGLALGLIVFGIWSVFARVLRLLVQLSRAGSIEINAKEEK